MLEGAQPAQLGYCRQCRRRPAILLLQLWQGCRAYVNMSAQRLPRVAINTPPSSHWATSIVRAIVVGRGQRWRQLTLAMLPPA